MTYPFFRLIALFFLFVYGVNLRDLNAQNAIHPKREPAASLDPAVRYGRLSNGFSYYIRKSEQPKDKIYMNLTVKAGHFQADADQVQYAHLIEHMAFLGTKNYPPSAKYLAAKAGLTFGGDVSAQTNGDDTHYYIHIPDKNNEALINDAFGILKDYAQSISFEPAKVDTERKVVISEIIERGTDENEVAYLKKVFPQIPVSGSKEAIENLRYGSNEALLRFYKDWYRPDLQAIIIVGDIDVDKMEERVKTVFAGLPPASNPRKRTERIIRLDGKNRLMVLTEGNNKDIILTILNKQLPVKKVTESDYRQLEIAALANKLISTRFQNIRKEKEHFVGNYIIKKEGSFGITGVGSWLKMAVRDPESLKAGLTGLVMEVERISRYGFTEAEIADAKKSILNGYRDDFDKISLRSIAGNLQQHFVYGTAALDPESEYILRSAFVSEITSADITSLCRNWFAKTNRDIIIQASRKEGLPGESTILGWIEEARAAKLEPYKYSAFDKELFTADEILKLSPGEPVSSKYLKDIDVTELVLPNGVKVVLKPLPNELLSRSLNNRIELQGFASGGTSLYSDSLYWEAKYAPLIIAGAGAGPLTSQETDRFKKQRKISSLPYVDEEHRGIRATAVDDIESMLQLVNRYFTSPNKSQEAFMAWVTKQKKALNSKVPKKGTIAYGDSVHLVQYNYDFREMPIRNEDIDNMQFERIYKIYRELYDDARKFTFVITGDFVPEKMIPLVIKYLGTLPSKNKSKAPLKIGGIAIKSKYPRDPVAKTYYLNDEENAVVDLRFFGLRGYFSEKEHVKQLLLRNYLYSLLMKRMRDKEGAVYKVQVLYFNLPPFETSININFITSPEHLLKMIAAVREEISGLQTNGVQDSLFYDSKKLTREGYLNTNNRGWFLWQPYLVEQYMNNRDPLLVLNRPAVLDQVTAEELQETAKKYLDTGHLQQFVLMPLSNKPGSRP